MRHAGSQTIKSEYLLTQEPWKEEIFMNKQSFVRVGTPAIHRALSGILAFVLAISLMPSIAWAQADDQSQEDSLSQLSQSEDYTGTTGSINSSETILDSSTLESTNSASGASSATNSGTSATTTSASS